MKPSALPLSLLALAALTGCSPSNPLVGHWTSTTPSTAYGAGGCPTEYTFTPTTQTIIFGAKESTDQVTYGVQPNLVFVNMQLGSNGFKFTSPNTTEWSTGGCTYKRD